MRLINADKFDVLSYTEKSKDFTEGVEFVVDQIDNAETIIQLPDNPTNGDIIAALFPDVIKDRLDVEVEMDGTICFSTEWWDAPYKGNIK